MVPSYRDAVETARHYLDENDVAGAPEWFRKMQPVRFAFDIGYAIIDEDGKRIDEPEFGCDEDTPIDELIEIATTDQPGAQRGQLVFTGENASKLNRLLFAAQHFPPAYDALILIAANMAMFGMAYPAALGEWVGKVLRGMVRRPAKKGRYPNANYWRDLIIADAVYDLVNLGMNPTRNDASEPTSACDAVADAMRELGVSPGSYDRVKHIWMDVLRNS